MKLHLLLVISILHASHAAFSQDVGIHSSTPRSAHWLLDQYKEYSPKVEQEIKQYDDSKDVKCLVRAFSNLLSITAFNDRSEPKPSIMALNPKTDRDIFARVFDLRLAVYDRCLSARDMSYDFKKGNRSFSINTAPPMVEGENLIAGMNPADIKNIDARIKYEKDILENKNNEIINKRENTLKQMEDRLLRATTNYLTTIMHESDDAIKQRALESVNKHMTIGENKNKLIKFIKELESSK